MRKTPETVVVGEDVYPKDEDGNFLMGLGVQEGNRRPDRTVEERRVPMREQIKNRTVVRSQGADGDRPSFFDPPGQDSDEGDKQGVTALKEQEAEEPLGTATKPSVNGRKRKRPSSTEKVGITGGETSPPKPQPDSGSKPETPETPETPPTPQPTVEPWVEKLKEIHGEATCRDLTDIPERTIGALTAEPIRILWKVPEWGEWKFRYDLLEERTSVDPEWTDQVRIMWKPDKTRDVFVPPAKKTLRFSLLDENGEEFKVYKGARIPMDPEAKNFFGYYEMEFVLAPDEGQKPGESERAPQGPTSQGTGFLG